jgi:hypothetical protein
LNSEILGFEGVFFRVKNPNKLLKFLDLFSFVKSTCKKFAKKSGKEGKGFANQPPIRAVFYRNFIIGFNVQNVN